MVVIRVGFASQPGGYDSGVDPRFVIHEHWASSHHFDLRLERDGTLASWAVPKGLPDRPDRNRLAVQVDDHDLDHLDFVDDSPVPGRPEGTMRKSIWDAGTYELLRSTSDKLVFELRGRRVSGRYALVRTKGGSWLLHLMQ